MGSLGISSSTMHAHGFYVYVAMMELLFMTKISALNAKFLRIDHTLKVYLDEVQQWNEDQRQKVNKFSLFCVINSHVPGGCQTDFFFCNNPSI